MVYQNWLAVKGNGIDFESDSLRYKNMEVYKTTINTNYEIEFNGVVVAKGLLKEGNPHEVWQYYDSKSSKSLGGVYWDDTVFSNGRTSIPAHISSSLLKDGPNNHLFFVASDDMRFQFYVDYLPIAYKPDSTIDFSAMSGLEDEGINALRLIMNDAEGYFLAGKFVTPEGKTRTAASYISLNGKNRAVRALIVGDQLTMFDKFIFLETVRNTWIDGRCLFPRNQYFLDVKQVLIAEPDIPLK